MTVEDYLESRTISDPLCIYDCDVPVDGAMAVAISRARPCAWPGAVRIEAIGTASGFQACAEIMWERLDLTPGDVDIAEVYDGFSIYAVRWLEALRLVPRNEAGLFLQGGQRIALDGELPISTGGGQLSGGRVHGYTALLEACIQLRGLGGEGDGDASTDSSSCADHDRNRSRIT
ncbi:hypothetical protein [Mycobacterium sp. 852002-40037_SCH5390672]|uniref:thiolase C-terminal domain-containing protein n=1 Tax=Mycobacterium sp. 852002-40037_SCH5390672 TaxID=1834089 RepID=UPI0012E799E8|nr:hypothetical protein [Mycobacterium sp. 852002-40037_SCH5390672]